MTIALPAFRAATLLKPSPKILPDRARQKQSLPQRATDGNVGVVVDPGYSANRLQKRWPGSWTSLTSRPIPVRSPVVARRIVFLGRLERTMSDYAPSAAEMQL